MKSTTSEWLDFAVRDLHAAKRLSTDLDLSTVVLFHCQQAIEKSLKALLNEYNGSVPRIHSVYTLFEKLHDEIKQKLDIKIENLEIIDSIYIDSRYPSDIGLLPSGNPTEKELFYILELTEKIFNSASDFLKE